MGIVVMPLFLLYLLACWGGARLVQRFASRDRSVDGKTIAMEERGRRAFRWTVTILVLLPWIRPLIGVGVAAVPVSLSIIYRQRTDSGSWILARHGPQ